jgi:ribosomal protein S18 acetylase RimI-like enzyme
MAYQFFAKAQAQQHPRTASSPPLSPPPPATSSNRPPIHPPPLVLPPSAASSTPSNRSSVLGDPNFQPTPYPDSNPPSYPTPHPHITIDPVRTVHIPSLSRITGLLLPIRYPSSFYTACITDPVIASLSRVAVYHDHPVTAAPVPGSVEPTFAGRARSSSGSAGGVGTDKVIGGIRCRLERHPKEEAPGAEDNTKGKSSPPTNLYIQTLHLLSPHRGNGIAVSLLNSLLFSQPPSSPSSSSSASSKSSYRVSPLVRHYNIRTVTAHVHETNEEGLKWYVARGFHIEDGVVQGYYRRLNPGGARIVRLDLHWDDDDDENERQQKDRNKGEERENNGKKRQDDDDDDDDWEKVEVEEDDDPEEHGIEHLTDSRTFDSSDDALVPTRTSSSSSLSSSSTATKRKRKADEELQSGL